MTRVSDDRWESALTTSVGMQCFEQGIAVRMADDFCDGLRQMLETPVSLVIVSSSLAHLLGRRAGQALRDRSLPAYLW